MQMRIASQQRSILILVALFVLGFIFRLTVAIRFPQPLIWDQEQYYGYALGIMNEGLHGDTVRLYGYPVLLVPFLYIFGNNFQWPFTCFQALLDCFTAVLIYLLAKKLFTRPGAAWTGYALYLANPFTPAYVGVVLTEVAAIFLVTFVMYLIFEVAARKDVKGIAVLALTLGYLPQVRPSFGQFSMIILGWVLYQVWIKLRSIRTGVIVLLLFFLPYTYNVAVNIYRYRQFSLQTVDNFFVMSVYISLFIDRAAPPGDYSFSWPQEVYNTWFEFSSPTTPAGRAAMSEKYRKLALRKIQDDLPHFVQTRLQKSWYVWEKHFLFPYIPQSGGKPVRAVIYGINLVTLSVSVIGYVFWFATKAVRASRTLRTFACVSLFLVAYISVAHVFSTSEERFSLPGYPIVYLFAGYGLVQSGGLLKRFARPTYETDSST